MRRASTCLAVIGMALLALPGIASATPTVTFKAQAVQIPGYPGTGNILGAGAAFQAEYTISGNEYGGYAPPLIGVNVFLPAGVKLHTTGFPTCPAGPIEKKEPEACPKKSAAGPKGTATGFVVFGGEHVFETVSVESFYVAGGGISFIVLGHSPASIELVAKGHYASLNGGGGFGPEFVSEVPLIETVPGANDGTTSSIKVKVGSAMKKNGKTIYYGTMPKKCPKGGFPVKSELLFAGLGGLSPQTVTVNYKAPCPRK